MVIDPYGEVAASCAMGEEGTVTACLDMEALAFPAASSLSWTMQTDYFRIQEYII